MALRLIQIMNQLPVSYPVDPAAEFQPGMVAQLKTIGNDIVVGVSDGFAPFGIIDDINTRAFTSPVTNEVVIIYGMPNADGYFLMDTKQELDFSNIIQNSFVSDVEGLVLNPVNGVLTATAGTLYNYDSNNDGLLDSVKTTVSYIYRIANMPGDNTTIGSGQMTVWIGRGIYETDQYDPRAVYALNASLFVNSEGFLTTTQESVNQPRVGIVSGPPTPLINNLELMWY